MTKDTGPAKLPSLPSVSTGNASLDRWIQAVSERMEVREGARGNPYERAVTVRELLGSGLSGLTGFANRNQGQAGSVLTVNPDGTYSTMTPDAFAESIRKSKLYIDLMKRLDDVTRFDGLPEQVKAVLLTDLAAEAARRGADIRRLEHKLQSATESLAYTVEEVTAAVQGSVAGVRETVFASATENNATAGKVTQLVAALDGTGSATAEESLVVIADRTAGLSSQYMLKLNAGNAVAGIGLMASEDPSGLTTSEFIVQADKFAVVMPGLGSAIPFGVDASGVYINGSLRINAGGTALQDAASGTAGTSYGVAYAYKRSATDLIAPWSATTNGPGAITWTFASGSITTPATDALLNGWTKAIPAGADPLYVTVCTAAGTAPTDSIANTEWATPALLTQNGTNGLNVATAILYQRNSSATVGPTAQANTVTFTFSNGAMSGMSAGWTTAIPAASSGAYLWVTRATASATGLTDTLAAGEWSAPVLYTQDGSAGTGVVAYATSQAFSIDNTNNSTPGNISCGLTLGGGLSVSRVNNDYSWSVVQGTFTGSLTTINNSTGAFAQFAPAAMTTDSVTFRGTFTPTSGLYAGTPYTDDITIVKLRQGVGVSVFLTNESHTVPADTSGNVTSWAGAGGTFKVYSGTTDVTTSCTFSVLTNTSVITTSIGASTGVFSATAAGSWAAGTTTATITYRATFVHPVTGTQNYDKVFTLTKALTGATGNVSTTPGPAGTRGTITTKITGAWNATTAAAAVSAIATAAGSTPTNPIKGDIVYYTGGANECTVAGNPGTWGTVAAYIDGSLVVTGTIAGNRITAGTVSADRISASSTTIATGMMFGLGQLGSAAGAGPLGTNTASGVFSSSTAGNRALLVANTSATAGDASAFASKSGNALVAMGDWDSSSNANVTEAYLGNASAAGIFRCKTVRSTLENSYYSRALLGYGTAAIYIQQGDIQIDAGAALDSAGAPVAATRKLKVVIGGTNYYIPLSTS